MDPEYQRTIDELITRYTLEPELRDIYVEGPSEKVLFDWFFKQFTCNSVTIFEIDSVNIPNSLTTGYGLQPSNRNEVVVLSKEFERLLQKDAKYLLCFADSDFDFLLGRGYSSRYLLYSDYTCIDLCFCSQETIEKFFMAVIRHLPCAVEALLDNFAKVLQEVFLIRTANEKLGWGLQWVGFVRSCSIDKDNLIVFNREKFIEKYLLKNNRIKESDKFDNICKQLRNKKVKTIKHRIRGHDFYNLLGWYISRKVSTGGNIYRNEDVIRNFFFMAVNPKSLTKEEPFKTLLNLYKS